MKLNVPDIPKKHRPRGFQIIHEDLDLIVGIKAAGYLTVSALWEKENSLHQILNQYVRKGNPKSRKCVYVVHRLDQGTSGILIFAKSEATQNFLKDNWKANVKTYFAITQGCLTKKSGTITSYLQEDEDYVMHSSKVEPVGKLAITEYTVLKESDKYSLVKINLLTGRKNQIRVHLADEGLPIVGDTKYGKSSSKFRNLFLHAYALTINHPHSKERVTFTAPVPEYFNQLLPYDFSKEIP